ncbi:phosphopantetheine-binding protein, partial [Mycobacterium gordonae]|uniref:phosphopantetheine-binding protein n=1 Tax=Mycobacterium gordonae TaxID=1778 RepID=UPI000A45B10E
MTATASGSAATAAANTCPTSPTGTDHLIAYIGPAPLDPTTIRHQLSRRLPAYLTPTHVIVLDEFPHTPSGKLDRGGVRSPVFTPTRYRPPHTPTEHIIADTFAEVLGLDRVGLDDNFFTLGGDSLLATRATTRLQLALNTEIPIRTLFDTPTVTDLANHLR